MSSNRDLSDFLDYLEYLNHDLRALPSMDNCKTAFLDLIIRRDGVPVCGRTWVQLSIGFANFGRLSRMLPYLWTTGVGVVPGMGMFSGDLLEPAKAVIKDMHNNYSNRARAEVQEKT